MLRLLVLLLDVVVIIYVSLISNDFLDGFVTCGIIGGTDPLSYEIGVSL